MALWVRNNPMITKSVLSREITKLVIVHVKAKVHRLLQKQKADVARTMDFFFLLLCNAATHEWGCRTRAKG